MAVFYAHSAQFLFWQQKMKLWKIKDIRAVFIEVFAPITLVINFNKKLKFSLILSFFMCLILMGNVHQLKKRRFHKGIQHKILSNLLKITNFWAFYQKSVLNKPPPFFLFNRNRKGGGFYLARYCTVNPPPKDLTFGHFSKKVRQILREGRLT